MRPVARQTLQQEGRRTKVVRRSPVGASPGTLIADPKCNRMRLLDHRSSGLVRPLTRERRIMRLPPPYAEEMNSGRPGSHTGQKVL